MLSERVNVLFLGPTLTSAPLYSSTNELRSLVKKLYRREKHFYFYFLDSLEFNTVLQRTIYKAVIFLPLIQYCIIIRADFLLQLHSLEQPALSLFHPIISHLVYFLGEHLGADFPDILHIGDDQHSAIYNHSE